MLIVLLVFCHPFYSQGMMQPQPLDFLSDRIYEFGPGALVFQLMKDRFDENARISMRAGAPIKSEDVHICLLHFG
jgi:hypothetical protein